MEYTGNHGKTYATKSEYKMRQANWMKTDTAIKAHNADPSATSTTGHNYMSDYTEAEFKNQRGFDGSLSAPTNVATDLDGAPPANGIDWVTLGKVTPVQN